MIILTQAPTRACSRPLTGYDGRQIRFRVWWVRDYGKGPPGDLVALDDRVRAAGTRPAGMPEWVYMRRVVSGGD